MKKLVMILVGLIVVIFLALMVVPKMINWNAKIVAMVKESTGRDLRIDGDVLGCRAKRNHQCRKRDQVVSEPPPDQKYEDEDDQ